MVAPVHHLINEAKREMRKEFQDQIERLEKQIAALESALAASSTSAKDAE